MTGLDNHGQRWQAWLNLDNAAPLLVEEPENVGDVSLRVTTPEFDKATRRKRAELDTEVPADAEGALVWVAAAGIHAAAKYRIEELLRAQETFVEELFSALLDELGFPESHSALIAAVRCDA